MPKDEEAMKPGKLFGDVTHLHFLKMNQALSALDLGKGQPPILRYLTINNGCIQSDIAKQEKKAPATITVMLKTMEKNGLIERKSDPADHRTMRVYITDKGREAHENVGKMFAEMDREVFSVFDEKEYGEFLFLLGKMKGRLLKLLGIDAEDYN